MCSTRVALVACWLVAATAATAAPALDLRSAELYLKRLDGRSTKLAPFIGRLTIVNLWATWCGPCREEMPALDALRKRYRARGVEVVGIALDHDGAQVRRYLAQHPVSYPILLATERTVPALGELESVPTSLLLDRRGGVLEVLVGAVDGTELQAEIDAALARP
jgi:thiol-disulfide isomerase/thioredoxin